MLDLESAKIDPSANHFGSIVDLNLLDNFRSYTIYIYYACHSSSPPSLSHITLLIIQTYTTLYQSTYFGGLQYYVINYNGFKKLVLIHQVTQFDMFHILYLA
jgi:hypothetical protein